MKKQRIVPILGLIFVTITSGHNLQADDGNRLILNLITPPSTPYSVGYQMVVPGGALADCFDVPLYNAKNGEYIGTATDCLSEATGNPADGIALVGTTFFNLPHGQIVTRGNTTVQPATTTIVTPDGLPITHVTGASGQGNGILSGTGCFEDAEGTVRLSGLVNLSRLASDGEIAFDCVFVIDLAYHDCDDDDSDDDSDDD